MFIEPTKLEEAEPEALADLLHRRSASASSSIFLVYPTCESETTSFGERGMGGEGMNRLVTLPPHPGPLQRMIGTFLVTVVFAVSFLQATLSGAVESSGAEKPNVILINCDDLGYGDLGCYGANDIRTPHLNQMANEGTRFTDFSVTAALCTPSRASLMTGKYPGRVGLATGVLRPDSQNGLASTEVTLAEVFKQVGYKTGCIGKWHLGFVPGMRPMDQGFDRYYGVLHNLDKFETIFFEKEGGMPILRGDSVEKRPALPSEMTGLYTIEALRFIEDNQSHPFFLYLGHAMPHLPFDASPKFKGHSQRGLYGEVVEELDDSTGQILNKLRSLGLAEKTLVIFTSDNGPERNTPGTATPLRGTKHTVLEGGLRVPCIAWWPGTVPANRVCNEFISSLDILPTFARLIDTPASLFGKIDGYDVSRVLFGKKDASSPRTTLYSLYGHKQNRRESFREGQWKLHLSAPPELYDLASSVSESTNVASQHPEIVERLKEFAQQIRVETAVPWSDYVPFPNE